MMNTFLTEIFGADSCIVLYTMYIVHCTEHMYNDRGERVQRVQGVAEPNLTITNKTFTHFATVSKKCTKMTRKKRLKEKYISIRMLS